MTAPFEDWAVCPTGKIDLTGWDGDPATNQYTDLFEQAHAAGELLIVRPDGTAHDPGKAT